MKHLTIAAAFLAAIAAAIPAQGFAQSASSSVGPIDLVPHLRVIEDKIGTGDVAKPGQSVTVNYTGWLYVNGAKGDKFDSSYDRNQPFTFTLGAGQVIAGWDQGVAGMKVGGKRTLIIPPALGYGAQAAGQIPPESTLIFDVELLGVQ